MKEVLCFRFAAIEGEESDEIVLCEITMPTYPEQRRELLGQMEDAISSYVDSVPSWTFDELVRDVASSFDPDAKIIYPYTFVI